VSKIHVVEQGDCLSSIAERYHLKWQTLWDAKENAALKQKRHSPNVLYPGDEVVIPSAGTKTVQLDSGGAYEIVVAKQKAKLKLVFQVNGKPLAGEPFELAVDDTPLIQGKTDGTGAIDERVPPGSRSAVVTFPGVPMVRTFSLGALDPASEASGAEARLRLLGAEQMAIAELEGSFIELALLAFQRANDLEETGTLDDETIKTLQNEFGC
jgi:hypothetical protein